MQLLDGTLINKRQFDKWINALRSGKYKQGKFRLQSVDQYCCLGVACEVLFGEKANRNLFGDIAGTYPDEQPSAPVWLKNLNTDFKRRLERVSGNLYYVGPRLSYCNDSGDHTFDEIADLLELVYVHGALEAN